MTKKDYELIAGVLKNLHDSDYLEDYTKHEYITRLLADSLAQDNPRFDYDKFLTACGVGFKCSWSDCRSWVENDLDECRKCYDMDRQGLHNTKAICTECPAGGPICQDKWHYAKTPKRNALEKALDQVVEQEHHQYQCHLPSCTASFQDVEAYTKHKQVDHAQ